MWFKRFYLVVTLSCLAMTSVMSNAGDKEMNSNEKIDSLSELSPKLRQLFQKEMKLLEKGVSTIIMAYISGDFDTLALTAKKMKESYILKDNLSKDLLYELHTKLPESFLQEDQNFHHYTELLAQAAKDKNSELSHFYLSKIMESCASCHSQHATHRFDGFLQHKQLPTLHHEKGSHSHH